MTHASVLHAVILFCAGAFVAAFVRADDAPRLAAVLAAGLTFDVVVMPLEAPGN